MTDGITTTTARRLRMTPTRRLTLVLGVPVLLALIGWTGFSAVDQLGSASFPVSYTFPPGNGRLTTSLEGGTITLRQAATVSTPVLTGTAHYNMFRSSFTHSGDTVRYHCPSELGNCELNATLQVPVTSAVSLSTDGDNVNLPSYSQDATVNTGGGDLTAGTVTGSLNLDTSGGDLTANTASGSLNLDTSGGDLTAGTASGSLNLNTGGGDLNVTNLTGSPAKLLSGGGDVTVQAMATSGTTEVNSYGGNVSLTFTKAPTNLRVTSGGGDVTIVLPRGSYIFNSNAGGGDLHEPDSAPGATDTITVQSGGGDISISY